MELHTFPLFYEVQKFSFEWNFIRRWFEKLTFGIVSERGPLGSLSSVLEVALKKMESVM